MSTKKDTTSDFIEIEDNNGFKTKVVNFDNPKMCPRTGIIDIMAIRVTNRHENRKSFSVTRDKQTDIVYGIPMGIDKKTGELKFRRIILYNSLQLNLKNPEDAKLWTVIRYCEFLEGSPNMRGKAEYKVHDREVEAQKVIVENKSKRKAALIIDDLSILEMYDMARNCGLSVENDSPAMVQSLLYKKSENNPDEFLNIYDDINRPVLTVFKRGLVTGLVRFDINKGYVWKESLPLGGNDSAVVKYLKQNVSLLVTMDQETKQMDNVFKANAKDEDYKKSVLDALSNENNTDVQTYTATSLSKENTATEKRLAQKEAEMDKEREEMRSTMSELKQMMEGLKDVVPKTEDIKPDDELIQLRANALKLGFKDPDTCDDKKKLKKFIKDQKELIEE